jgi:putative ABC transport system permease protein
LGITLFIAKRKTKEIGIRKVLGAGVKGIVYLLTRQFLIWVLIANILAWPLSYFLLDKWLQNFAYRINIDIWNYLAAGVLTFIIAFFTLWYVIFTAARSNPIESLRYE